MPAFGSTPLGRIGVDDVLRPVAELVESVEAGEVEYLRLHEIPLQPRLVRRRPPAARRSWSARVQISEALALRVGDVEHDDIGGFVTVYRSRKREVAGSSKSDRLRSVVIGPARSGVLREPSFAAS